MGKTTNLIIHFLFQIQRQQKLPTFFYIHTKKLLEMSIENKRCHVKTKCKKKIISNVCKIQIYL